MKAIKLTMLIALCAMIFGGCSKKEMPAHLVAVPQNATVVFAFNAKQIIDKAGLNHLEQYKMYSLLKNEMETQPAEMRDFINEFLKDTRTSGLNLDHVFGYVALKNEKEPYGGFTFLIDDVKKFEATIAKSELPAQMISERKIDMNGFIMQWDDKVVAAAWNTGEINLLNSDESQSILAKETFNKAYESDKDMFVFFEYDGLCRMAEDMVEYINPLQLAQLNQYRDFIFGLSFNSEKGKLVAETKMYPEDKVAELYAKYYKNDFNNELYNYFPDKSLFAVKFGIKPLETYAQLKQSFGAGLPEMPGHSTMEAIDALVKQNDEKITKILGCFTGDMLASVWDLGNIMTPGAAMAAGIVDEKESEVIALLQEIGFTQNSEGYYQIQASVVPAYFAIKDNMAYCTLSKDAITKFLANGFSPNITSAKDFGAELKNANSYAYYNLNINDYPEMVSNFIGMSEEGRLFLPLLSKFKSLTGRNIGTSAAEIKIQLTENDEYATRTILKHVDDIVAQYFNTSH